jgi:hypothetical protein
VPAVRPGGYHVLVAGRTAAKINKVSEAIISAGGSAEPIATDATLEQDVASLKLEWLKCAENLHRSGVLRDHSGTRRAAARSRFRHGAVS